MYGFYSCETEASNSSTPLTLLITSASWTVLSRRIREATLAKGTEKFFHVAHHSVLLPFSSQMNSWSFVARINEYHIIFRGPAESTTFLHYGAQVVYVLHFVDGLLLVDGMLLISGLPLDPFSVDSLHSRIFTALYTSPFLVPLIFLLVFPYIESKVSN